MESALAVTLSKYSLSNTVAAASRCIPIGLPGVLGRVNRAARRAIRQAGCLGILVLMSMPATAIAQMGGPALVKVATASVKDIAPVTLVPGTVVSRNDARLSAEVEGRLTMVADVGTEVAGGDPVATIEDTTLRLQAAELEAQVTRRPSPNSSRPVLIATWPVVTSPWRRHACSRSRINWPERPSGLRTAGWWWSG
jgi:CTP synthase (UTP-ammonia lyase)